MFKKIYLTKNKDTFLKLFYIDKSISNYLTQNFEKIKNNVLKNNYESYVLVKRINNYIEQKCERNYKSYLCTPKFDKNSNKSYMFSGKKQNEIESNFPTVLSPLYNYIKKNDNRYNNMIINYYKNSNSYIPMHSDCCDSMIKNANIGILSIYSDIPSNNSPNNNIRKLTVKSKNSFNSLNNNLINNNFTINLHNGLFIIMGGKFQVYFRHGILKENNNNNNNNNNNQRLGISFRQY